MSRYMAFLRGVNISGKNKLPMLELKQALIAAGFSEVVTYLNSGNVAYSCENCDENILANKVSALISNKFKLDIPVIVVNKEHLEHILDNAPDWWGNEDKEIYDNLIFVVPLYSCKEICDEIGSPKEGLEKIQCFEDVIFWSFSLEKYQKTNWWPRTASEPVKDKITIRTANTVRKIVKK